MTIMLDTIILPDEMQWLDEFEWSPVRTLQQYTISGTMIRQESQISGQKGRPITLGGDNAWITRQTMLSLMALAWQPWQVMALSMHDSRIFTVGFAHPSPPVLVVEPVMDTAYPEASTLYKLTLKLQVV